MPQFLTFRLAGLDYGLDIRFINSVLEPQPVTPIRCEGDVVKGLTNVRGLVVPIIDAKELLARSGLFGDRMGAALEAKTVPGGQGSAESGDGGGRPPLVEAPAPTRGKAGMVGSLGAEEPGIIVIEAENGTLLPFVGLLADTIGRVVRIESGDVAPVPEFLGVESGKCFEGLAVVAGKRIALLDARAMLTGAALFSKGRAVDE